MVNPSVVQDTQALLERETAMQERLNEILSSYQGKKEELIPILQQVQQVFGYLPEPAMEGIAKFLKLPESTVILLMNSTPFRIWLCSLREPVNTMRRSINWRIFAVKFRTRTRFGRAKGYLSCRKKIAWTLTIN